jgi:nucleotide sugar dehydrogenase
MRIAIVGHGFVGKAVDYGFTSTRVKKKIIDPKYGTSVEELHEWAPDFTFVCVPTPMGEDGDINTTILDEVMKTLRQVTGIIVVKSTITPDIISKYHVVYNPEFLTEKSACEQFVSPEFHIMGGNPAETSALEKLYEDYSLCTPCPVYKMTKAEASFVKYAINSFLATKVTFFNQLYDSCNSHGANFNKVIKAVGADKRISISHTKVPGFDGKQGYGGACFPKDTLAFSKFDSNLSLLEKAIEINNNYRIGYELDDREKEQNIRFDK